MIKDMYYMIEFIRLLIFIKIVIKNVIRMRMMMMMMMIIIIIIIMMVMMTMIMRMRLSSIIYEVIGGIQHFFFYEEILQAKNA